jgi:Nuclease A inhibitor-like protein
MTHPAQTALRKATRGLLYGSEKDAPFKVVTLKTDTTVTADTIALLVGKPADSPVETVAFEKFFGELTTTHKWHSADDRAIVKRYQDLSDLLHKELNHRHVFKIGKVKVTIVIIGQAADGTWIGLETDSLET